METNLSRGWGPHTCEYQEAANLEDIGYHSTCPEFQLFAVLVSVLHPGDFSQVSGDLCPMVLKSETCKLTGGAGYLPMWRVLDCLYLGSEGKHLTREVKEPSVGLTANRENSSYTVRSELNPAENAKRWRETQNSSSELPPRHRDAAGLRPHVSEPWIDHSGGGGRKRQELSTCCKSAGQSSEVVGTLPA